MIERREGFWAFCRENPVMIVVILILLMGVVAILMGYKEGFASVLAGIFGFLKKDDGDRKIQEKELEVRTAEANSRAMEREILASRVVHDEEVEESAASAKAECDEMDIDELVDIGNAMLRDHGVLGGPKE